jgi:hypothetical protein
MIADYYDDCDVLFFTHHAGLINNLRETIFNIIYASNVSNISPFSKSFNIKNEENNTFTFSNGSTLKLLPFTEHEKPKLDDLKYQLITLDNSGLYVMEDDTFNNLYESSNQMLIGASSALKSNNFVYNLWVNSTKGKNDFTYTRLPLDVTKDMKLYEKMKDQLSKQDWLRDVELASP